jgi:3-methyl-2-oxobutanoate hydroxymethyltransferase
MGHLGLTPQAVHRMGGYRVQARTRDAIERIREDAHLLAGAGCFAVVLEGVPREVAARLTAELTVPTIGIGAGPACDGQILVWHDLLGISTGTSAKFVRRFAEAGATMRAGLEAYRAAVEAGTFPADEESYHLPRVTRDEIQEAVLCRG